MADDLNIILVVVGCAAGVILVVTVTVIVWYKCKIRKVKFSDEARLEEQPLLLSVNQPKRRSVAINSSIQAASPAKSNGKQETNDDIVLQAKMYVRGTPYTNLQFLKEIGTRKGKYYFMVEKNRSQAILSMTPIHMENCKLNERQIRQCTKILQSITNPYIAPIYDIDIQRDKNLLFTFRPFVSKGSLRDLINQAKPTDPYNKKYNTIAPAPLNEKKIAKFGRMILEGLRYLELQKIPYYQLHAGNIIIDNGVCKLSEIENDFIGVKPRLHFLIRPLLGKIHPMVVTFGAVLYEMTIGYELDSIKLDDLPADCPNKVKKILNSIFLSDSPLSVQDLLDVPLFKEAQIYSDWVPESLKIDEKSSILLESVDTSCKEALLRVEEKKRRGPPRSTPVGSASNTNRVTMSSTPKVSSTSSSQPTAPAAPPPSAQNNPPPPPPPPVSQPRKDNSRSQLLGSIESFSHKKLKKAKTNDRSAPKV